MAIGAVAVAALAAGSGAAVATSRDGGREAEQEVLADAAKRLDVTPQKLRSALSAAQDAQLEAAVKEGRLTQEQADAIKARRRQDGRVLGVGPGHHHGPGFGGPGMRRGLNMFSELAEALDLSEEQLLDRLHDGRSVAQIARAQNKDLDDVKAQVRDAQAKRLDAEVRAGRLTDAQRDAMLEHLDEHIDRLAEKRLGMRRFPGAQMRPGSFDGSMN